MKRALAGISLAALLSITFSGNPPGPLRHLSSRICRRRSPGGTRLGSTTRSERAPQPLT